MSPSLSQTLPPRPRVVLRVAFAGRKVLSDDAKDFLRREVAKILKAAGHCLAAVTRGIDVASGKEPRVSEFFAEDCPVLRLVTGLCEGADAVAAEELEKIKVESDSGDEKKCLQTELAAVIPFDLLTYRKSRPPDFHEGFESQAKRCSYILTLDGVYEKSDQEPPIAKERRNKAYRAQSAILLRQADMLLAAADFDGPGKAGGTLETLRAALAIELPVVFIDLGKKKVVRLIQPGEELETALGKEVLSGDQLHQALSDLVRNIVADPNCEINLPDDAEEKRGNLGYWLMKEFFDEPGTPPMMINDKGKSARCPTLRESFWDSVVVSQFDDGQKPKPDEPLDGYREYRSRATSLNYHYGGLYRGAFLVNYLLAVVAVLIATLSLALLSTARADAQPRDGLSAPSTQTSATQMSAEPPDEEVARPVWFSPLLVGLGITELCIVSFIATTIEQAWHERWSDRAVNMRYLAEQLRSMFYLPTIGSFRPPAARPAQYTDRAVHQSAADWLFNAIARSISPARWAELKEFRKHDDSGNFEARILTVIPETAVARVRDRWLEQQVVYHDRAARTNARLYRFSLEAGKRISDTVIILVAADVVIALLELTHLLPQSIELVLRHVSPWLLFVDAVLPAALAALYGIRFQSEFKRLAERSTIMRILIGGRPDPKAEKKPSSTGGHWMAAKDLAERIADSRIHAGSDLAAWSYDALLLNERIAMEFFREVADWSVLYAKELPET